MTFSKTPKFGSPIALLRKTNITFLVENYKIILIPYIIIVPKNTVFTGKTKKLCKRYVVIIL